MNSVEAAVQRAQVIGPLNLRDKYELQQAIVISRFLNEQIDLLTELLNNNPHPQHIPEIEELLSQLCAEYRSTRYFLSAFSTTEHESDHEQLCIPPESDNKH